MLWRDWSLIRQQVHTSHYNLVTDFKTGRQGESQKWRKTVLLWPKVPCTWLHLQVPDRLQCYRIEQLREYHWDLKINMLQLWSAVMWTPESLCFSQKCGSIKGQTEAWAGFNKVTFLSNIKKISVIAVWFWHSATLWSKINAWFAVK